MSAATAPLSVHRPVRLIWSRKLDKNVTGGADGSLAAASAILLGVGAALFYRLLIAAISDAVSPVVCVPTFGVALIAASGLWVAIDLPAWRRSSPPPAIHPGWEATVAS